MDLSNLNQVSLLEIAEKPIKKPTELPLNGQFKIMTGPPIQNLVH